MPACSSPSWPRWRVSQSPGCLQPMVSFVGLTRGRDGIEGGVMDMQDYGGYGSYGGNPPSDGGYPPSHGDYPPSHGDYPPAYGGYPPPYRGYPPPPPPPPRGPGLWRYLVVAVTAAALGAGTVLAVGHSSSNPVASPAPSSSIPGVQLPGNQPNAGNGSAGLGNSAQAVLAKVSPGLVIINTSLHYNAEAAAGTGMVLTSDGLVLTNNHVIANATNISVTLTNGRNYKAHVLGYDVTGDIAALQIEKASGLTTIPRGNSDTVKVGDAVIAMGNAQGQSEITPAQGAVTGVNQTVTAGDSNNAAFRETLHGMIQTNADVVSGDSGGALANAAGQVIGMNTAGNNGGQGTGIPTGFAIPINTAVSVVNQIVAGQASSTVTIGYPVFIGIFEAGVSSGSDPQGQAQAFNNQNFPGAGPGDGSQQACVSSSATLVPVTTVAPVSKGTLITGAICGGPAAGAGMQAGDVITALNGQSVGGPDQLATRLAAFKVGN